MAAGEPALLMAVLVLLAIAAGSRPVRAQGTTLPPPGGSHPVGVTELTVAVAATEDPVASRVDGRTVRVVLWYPAVAGTGRAPGYLTNLAERAAGLGEEFVADAGGVRSYARRDATPSSEDAPFPMVLLSHSLGGLPGLYAGLGEELASRGYLAVSVGHPGGAAALVLGDTVLTRSAAWDAHDPARVGTGEAFAFREARTRVWATDALEVLRELPRVVVAGEALGERVDLSRVGYIGHSMGGSAAAMGCAVSQSVDACVNLDGWPVAAEIREEGLSQPYLHAEESRPYRTSEQLQDWGVDRPRYDRIQAGIDAGRDSLFQAMRATSYHLVVDGLSHDGFSDLPLWSPSARAAQRLDPERGLEILRVWVGWFLDRHVRGDRGGRPPDPALFPEVRFTAYGSHWSQDRPEPSGSGPLR